MTEQKQEFEADVCGALLLKKLGASTGKSYRAADGSAQYISSGVAAQADRQKEGECLVENEHPRPEERMNNLKAYSVALDGTPR